MLQELQFWEKIKAIPGNSKLANDIEEKNKKKWDFKC